MINNTPSSFEEKQIEAKRSIEEYAKSLELLHVLQIKRGSNMAQVWYDKNGNDIDQTDLAKGAKIESIKSISIPRFSIADSESDFELIYNSQFRASGLSDTPFDYNVFINEFPRKLDELIARYKAKNSEIENYSILSSAERLKQYIISKSENLKTTVSNKQNPHKTVYENFSDIFVESDTISLYVDALEETKPPLIQHRTFIGKPRGDKGVICSWIFDLQNKGIIKGGISRQALATVLNNEIKKFNMGAAGKTISNHSNSYDKKFKPQLVKITNLK